MTPHRFFGLAFLLIAIPVLLIVVGRGPSAESSVVVYTSVDAEFALPLFEQFTKATSIHVTPRTDDEASKTTGMAERLLAMKGRPDGDVFWNSELSRTQVLANEGVLEAYDSPSAKEIPAAFRDPGHLWTGFGCRARVLIYNTQKVKRDEMPKTLEDLALPRWKDKVCVAKPLFGTTMSHLVSLTIEMGEEDAFKLFRAWRANGVTVVESNGDVRNRVVDGQFDIGLTDNDDVLSAMDRNKPVDYTVPDQTSKWPGAYLIPNTVSILKNAPHQKEARAFVDFLLRPETEKWLAENGARQIPVRDTKAELAAGLRGLKPAKYNADELAKQVRTLGERIFRTLNGDTK